LRKITLSKIVMNKGSKLSDEQFLSILRENSGLFAKTARAIREQFGIEYSRQAVRVRAGNHPEEVLDIAEENLDVAEDGLLTLLKSSNDNIRLRAIELLLKTKGKMRGYTEKTELNITGTINIEPKKWADADNAE